MRWPFDKRADPTTVWGFVGLGVTVDGVIIGALATLNGSKPGFRWYWPTNVMILGGVLVAFGLLLLIVPVKRSPPPPPPPLIPPLPKQIFTGDAKAAEKANKKTADKVKEHMAEGAHPDVPEHSHDPQG